MNQTEYLKRWNLILVLLLFSGICMFSAETSINVFSARVKTLTVGNPNNFMASPVLRLNTGDVIRINFDIIEEEHEYLRYKLIHCNADWKPSRLLESEYVDGFNEAEIDDYAYSENTFVHYVNYNIEIPNRDMRILRSGNYLLQVYPEGEPDDILLQTRFSVSENTVPIVGGVTSRTDKGFNNHYQQLYFSIDLSGKEPLNPYQDIIVTLMQNNRPETLRVINNPIRIDGTKVVYEHDLNLVFDASNEYRRFETVRADYPGMNIDSVKFGGSNWHSWLKTDEPRADRDYTYDSTQKGRFKIDEYNSSDPDLGADYVTVHFTLDSPEIIGGNVYIDGDLTLHQFDDRNRMIYNREKGVYELQIPLKQGSYNYQYVVKSAKSSYADSGIIEGNKYETQNEYQINVYLRKPGSRGDRLVGSSQIIMR